MDSNTPIWPTLLPVPMAKPRMLVAPRNLRTMMESGRIRSRRVNDEPLEVLEVQWSFTANQFFTFKDFFDDTLENGSLPFLIDIFNEEREMVFLESKYDFARSDNLFSVMASLEYLSLPSVLLTVEIEEVAA